jgi:hypothetical protein
MSDVQIDRRRVLQGVAWATPAVVIATAVPAMAVSGSPEEGGAIVIVSSSAIYASGSLTVKAQIAHTGNGAPVTGLKATISLPSWGMPGQTPTGVGAGWQFSSYATVGSNIVFTFTYVGGDLSAGNVAAAPLSASFANWSTSDTALTIGALGTSLALPVTASANVTATQAAALIFDPLQIFWVGNGAFHIGMTVHHTGPQNPAADDARNLVIEATYQTSKASAPTATSIGPWLVTPLGATGGVGKVRFTYNANAEGKLAIDSSTQQVELPFPTVANATSGSFTFTGSFTSAGQTGAVTPKTVSV